MLINREWKHSFESNPSNSVTSLVSLWDLMFDENENSWYEYYSTEGGGGRADLGCHLEHDLICFNSELYSINPSASGTHNVLNPVPATEPKESTKFQINENNLFYTFGIDIALPHYSAASRPKRISYGTGNSSVYLYINDKNAVIPYKDTRSFSINSISMEQTFGRNTKIDSNSIIEPSYFDNFMPIKVGPFDDTSESQQNDKFEIYLKGPNPTFLTDNSIDEKFSAYNNICINPNSSFAKYLVLRTLFNNNDDIYKIFGVHLPARLNASQLNTCNINYSELKEVLKNSFVWIRAPFFADYIKPSSYNQNLNKDSRVVHKDLILSKNGDFNEYNESVEVTSVDVEHDTKNIDNNTEWIDSLPYISQTAPIIDLLKPGNNISQESDDWFENEDIGGIPIPTTMFKVFQNIDSSSESQIQMFCPFIYWNTEYAEKIGSQNLWNTFTSGGINSPVFTKKYGNLYTDGRVFSPTIDELWMAFKYLVCGRADDSSNPIDKFGRAKGTEAGSLNYKNTESTLIPYSNSRIWKFSKNSKVTVGDPIKFNMGKYTFNDDGSATMSSTEVDKFINHNNVIDFEIYDTIQLLNNTLLYGAAGTGSYETTDVAERKENFYFSIPYEAASTSNIYRKDNIDFYSGIINQSTSDSNKFKSIFGPRTNPYSLRELEAISKGNRLNIESLAIWLKKNGVVNGKVAKRIANTGAANNYDNSAASGLYQLHKDYEGSHSKNTQYVQNGDSGYLQFDDNSKFATHYTSRASFGRTRISDTQNKVDSSQVFLAADGTWRYLFEKPRAQIVETSR